MTEGVIVAVITVVGAVIAAFIQGNLTAAKLTSEFEKRLAVSETKMDAITREVREQTNFARRVPVIEEQIRVINHRVSDLENLAKEK